MAAPLPPEPVAFSGLVLAAGRSSRMGTEKALLRVDGKQLWERQRDILMEAGAVKVFLSARTDQLWVQDVNGFSAVLNDAVADCGPLAGIAAGLERVPTELLAVVAIDLPRITSRWFGKLLAKTTSGVGVLAQHPGGFEPLAAIYPRCALRLAREAVRAGEYSLQHFARACIQQGMMRVHPVAGDELQLLANWNEPTRP